MRTILKNFIVCYEKLANFKQYSVLMLVSESREKNNHNKRNDYFPHFSPYKFKYFTEFISPAFRILNSLKKFDDVYSLSRPIAVASSCNLVYRIKRNFFFLNLLCIFNLHFTQMWLKIIYLFYIYLKCLTYVGPNESF